MARWVWMEFIDKLNPNHYYCHATYQKTNWSPTFPAKMGTKKTFQLLFCVLGLLEFEGNHIISLHSCYQHKKTIFWIRIRIHATLLRECFFALNAQHLSLNTQHFSIFLQSWAKYCWQVHKIKWNSFFFMEWSSADFSQFWSTTVKIWVLVGLLVTCHQYQAFHGFSWNLLIFVKSFVKLWGNSYIRTW